MTNSIHSVPIDSRIVYNDTIRAMKEEVITLKAKHDLFEIDPTCKENSITFAKAPVKLSNFNSFRLTTHKVLTAVLDVLSQVGGSLGKKIKKQSKYIKDWKPPITQREILKNLVMQLQLDMDRDFVIVMNDVTYKKAEDLFFIIDHMPLSASRKFEFINSLHQGTLNIPITSCLGLVAYANTTAPLFLEKGQTSYNLNGKGAKQKYIVIKDLGLGKDALGQDVKRVFTTTFDENTSTIKTSTRLGIMAEHQTSCIPKAVFEISTDISIDLDKGKGGKVTLEQYIDKVNLPSYHDVQSS